MSVLLLSLSVFSINLKKSRQMIDWLKDSEKIFLKSQYDYNIASATKSGNSNYAVRVLEIGYFYVNNI